MKLPRLTLPVAPPLSSSEFDPTLARLVARPPQPMPTVVLKIALGLLVTTLLWAAIGRLDVVAVAPGRLVPLTYVKIVQPAEAGIVRDILVREGELVRAGQVLMRMDPTLSAADLVALRTEYERKRLTLRRIDGELADRPFQAEKGDNPRVFAEVAAQYAANRNALAAAIAQERAGFERSRQEMAAAEQTRDKLQQTLPMYRDQEAAFRKLTVDGYAGKLMTNDKIRERIEKEQDLKTQEHVMERERANMTQSDKKVVQLRSDNIRLLSNERAEAADRFEKLAQELAKLDHRHGLLELKAPQSGRVKDLATHTTGTVAQPGTILMTLVPDNETLRAEVWLANDDVGFVRAGQPVKLKFAAFQFQKYGMLDGEVEQVAADAAEKSENPADAKIPQMAYRTLVRLRQQQLAAGDVAYRLAPGMQVSAEIILGERTILEYLLSPIRKAWHEGGRER